MIINHDNDSIRRAICLSTNTWKIMGYEEGEDYKDKIQKLPEVHVYYNKKCSTCKENRIEYRSKSEKVGKYWWEDCARKIGGDWKPIQDVIKLLRKPLINLKKSILQRQLYFNFLFRNSDVIGQASMIKGRQYLTRLYNLFEEMLKAANNDKMPELWGQCRSAKLKLDGWEKQFNKASQIFYEVCLQIQIKIHQKLNEIVKANIIKISAVNENSSSILEENDEFNHFKILYRLQSFEEAYSTWQYVNDSLIETRKAVDEAAISRTYGKELNHHLFFETMLKYENKEDQTTYMKLKQKPHLSKGNILTKLAKGGTIEINLARNEDKKFEDGEDMKTLKELSTKSLPLPKIKEWSLTFNFWKAKLQYIHKFLSNPYAIRLSELHFSYNMEPFKPKMTPLFWKTLCKFITSKVSEVVTVSCFSMTTAQMSSLIGASKSLNKANLKQNIICDNAPLYFPPLRVVNLWEETLIDLKNMLKKLDISSNSLCDLDLQSFEDNGYALFTSLQSIIYNMLIRTMNKFV